jgi:hypothetical protein
VRAIPSHTAFGHLLWTKICMALSTSSLRCRTSHSKDDGQLRTYKNELKARSKRKNPLDHLRGLANWLEKFYAARTTLPAWKPLGPLSRSNSTVSPSFSER